MQLSEDPLRALDRGEPASGRVKIGSCASDDLAPIVRDLCEQGRGPRGGSGSSLPFRRKAAGDNRGPDPDG